MAKMGDGPHERKKFRQNVSILAKRTNPKARSVAGALRQPGRKTVDRSALPCCGTVAAAKGAPR